MHRRGVISRLELGPVVGHTDETSARVWIKVFDDPALYSLRVQGAGSFAFESTEGGLLEFRTAIATATGLRPDRRYRYSVLRRGRVVARSRGSFRTLPDPASMASLLFCAVSCSTTEHDGLWEEFNRFVETAKPHFVLMMGDQVYIDEDEPDVYELHRDSSSSVRRRALAEKYRLNWSRDPIRTMMANVPTYMVWDDHDIRDGWGSHATDSNTLVARYPRGRDLFERSNAFFEDARDVYWHLQACRNPNEVAHPPLPGERRAMPFAFRCGRLAVLVLDSRGSRDVFRKEHPVLGTEQWGFLQGVLDGLIEDVQALAVVTPTPIASLDPHGASQKLLGDRTDDVVAFKKGREQRPSSSDKSDAALTIANVHLSRLYGSQLNLGNYKLSNIDEARDQWSHKSSRPEQASLLRAAGKARRTNTLPGTTRELIFLSGDVHVGCIFDISSTDPEYQAPSLTSSGISALASDVYVGVYVDEDFAVAPGIHSTLRQVVKEFNFGVVQVVFTGTGAEITPILAHEGASTVLGLDIADLL